MVEAAERDIKRLRNAKTSRGARAAWVSFLQHANTAWNRLEGYSKDTNQYEKYKLLKKEVWASDLTSYMRTARNVLEHGVEDLGISETYNDRVVLPNGQILAAPIVMGTGVDGRTMIMPAAGPIEVEMSLGVRVVSLRPGIRMIPIVDRNGETIMPPYVAALVAEDEPEPSAAARVYLAWVVQRINTFD